jgi:hypothetical protein
MRLAAYYLGLILCLPGLLGIVSYLTLKAIVALDLKTPLAYFGVFAVAMWPVVPYVAVGAAMGLAVSILLGRRRPGDPQVRRLIIVFLAAMVLSCIHMGLGLL